MKATIVRPSPAGFCVALAFAFSWVSAARAGVIVETAEHDLAKGGDKAITTLSTQDGKLRVERLAPGNKQPDSVFIFKDDTFFIIDDTRKSYTTMDRATMERTAERMGDAMKQMQDKLASLPPEQRAMVEKMMGKKAEQPKRVLPQFHKTGKSERVGSYTCQLWEATMENGTVLQHCVVPFGTVAGGQEMFEVMKKMAGMLQDMYKSMNTGEFKTPMNQEWEGLWTIDGYPVLTRSLRDGKPEFETSLKSSRNTSVPADRFEVPAGYKRQELGGL